MARLMRALLVAVILVGLVAGSAFGASAGAGSRKTYAVFKIRGYIDEVAPPVYILEPEEVLHQLLDRLHQAVEDPSIDGVIVRVGDLQAGWAKVQEIRDAIAACGDAGKDTVCFIEGADNRSYCLGSGARRMVMTPAGHLMLTGMRAEAMFLKELLDAIGVEADLAQAGKYKGAAEPLTRSGPTDAFRESLQSLVDSMYGQLLRTIAESREVPISQAEVLIRRAPYTAHRALEMGLVDDVLFYDELIAELEEASAGELVLKKNYGTGDAAAAAKAAQMNLFNLLMGGGPDRREIGGGAAIAVLYAVGPIMSAGQGLGLEEHTVTVEAFLKAIRSAVDDSNVKAIVLRVDSPGGSALACDTIWRELRLAAEQKPLVASFSDTAASGGYYLGVAAPRIFAEPGTLTGSIGVVGGKLVLGELLDKIGINVAVVTRGRGSGFMSSLEPYSVEERRQLQELIDDTYAIFLKRVSTTRTGLSERDLEAAAQGRVWTGAQARDKGLVDDLGGLADAVAAAREAAGIPADQEVRIIRLPRSKNIVEALMYGPEGEAMLQSQWPRALSLPALRHMRVYLTALAALGTEPVACLLPAAVVIR